MRRFLVIFVSLALLFGASTGEATRLTPSTRLSAQATGAGAHSVSTVSIPANTTTAIISFTFGYNVSNNQAPTGVTLDSQTAVKKVSEETANSAQIAYYTVLSGLSTGGSKTIAWTNPVAYSEVHIAIEYRDGSHTVGATDFDWCTSCANPQTLSTNPLANTSGDEILCAYAANGGSTGLTGSGAGQTTLDNTNSTTAYGFSTKTGAGGTTTMSFTYDSSLDTYACAVIGSAAPVLASPTPSGTLGTQTTATIGATTNTTSGTYYAVVDSAANLSGVTVAQIKAGQKASGAAALKSCNAAVSTTTPSCGVTGLTAATGYSYSGAQNAASGDSNIAAGTFTTAAAAPTFSVSPSIGTRTTSTIPVTATTACTDCTFYGIEQTAGAAAPSVAQVVAGQDNTGAAAFKACSVAMTANSQGTCTFSSITDGTVKDGYYALKSTANGNIAANVSIANQYKIPAFTTAITIASTSATAYTTNSDVLDGAGTVALAACKLGASAPTVAQVEAGSGGCIVNATTDNATGPFSLTITGTVFPAYDLYFVGTYGSQHEAAVHTLTGQFLSPPTGKQFITLTSIGTGSAVAALNAIITPDWAVGDIAVCDAATTPSGFGPVSPATTLMSASGFISYNAGGDTSRQYINCDAYDLSVGAYATAANANNDLDWWNNDPAILCSSPFSTLPYVLKTGVAMNVAPNPGNVDFTTKCAHPLGDALTFALTTGTWPTGLTLATPVLSGTATVENEAGASEVVTATSTVTGGTGTQPLILYPITTKAMPNCVSSPTPQISCVNSITAQYLSAINIVVTSASSATVTAGNVISQSPAGGAEVAPYATENLVVSLGLQIVIPNCLGKTVTQCQAIVAVTSVFAQVTPSQGCVSGDSRIYSQGPAYGTPDVSTFNLTVFCR